VRKNAINLSDVS